MTDVWQPGTTYPPGSAVVPISTPVTYTTTPANASFENGLTGWNARPGWFAADGGYNGGGCAALAAGSGADVLIVNTNQVPVSVGQSITASCHVAQGKAAAGIAEANVAIFWFDSDRERISVSDGNAISESTTGKWQVSTVTASAPAGAAFAAVGARGKNVDRKYSLRVDTFSWDYSNEDGASPLVFTATQAEPGKSGATEPSWPTTSGETVTDNEVTWTGSDMTSVTWTASRIMESGATEPAWPTTVGDTVIDGTITWVCCTPQVTDPNCPQSRQVAIIASKVYAADGDIIRFSSTSNPLDWTAKEDAGFLPFGLQTYGTNPIAAMGLYRGNLVAFNTEGFQMWQVDEDPANAALLDALPVGSSQQKALSPVANDLFFLASQGVRTMGIAAAAVNLQAGDVGMPIDPLVIDAMATAAAAGITPLATYYPSAGQYWLAFPEDEPDLFF